MNTDFRIGLISDDPYHLGLLNGYCQAHRYKILKLATDMESINTLIPQQPNIIFVAVSLTQDQAKKTEVELIRDLSINHKIPVCYLRDINNAANIDKQAACWVDAILDAPLDVNQLDTYLCNKFKHHHRFIQEKRTHARRIANDRRLLMIERQNKTSCNNRSTKHSPQNADADCFTVELFQIDQRSKSVLFNGKLLNLTRKEFELFELLAQDVDRVLMTDEIIKHLWPENNRATKSDLYQYMHLLRKKIENDPNNPQWILTVKGFGYKLNAAAPSNINQLGI